MLTRNVTLVGLSQILALTGTTIVIFTGPIIGTEIAPIPSLAVALWAIAARITEFGFSLNKIAALGENIILLVNLGWSAVLYGRILAGRAKFATLER